MVFSSIPVYLDPPNWPQQQSHQGEGSEIPNIPLVASQAPPAGGGGGGGGPAGSIRPGSMADRARLAKIPQPEAGLKCPRCESSNTKFCYFNNYSLTQPRHFCKTCRRYWTRGGALRNVPVGGGCRRNKRSKRSRSKSPIMASDRHATASTSNSAGVSSSTTPNTSDIIPHFPPPPSQLPFLPPLHSFNDYISRDVGLNFSRAGSHLATMVARGSHGNNNNTSDMEFQIGGTTTGLNGQMLPNSSFLHQFPFFANISPSQQPPLPPPTQPAGLYPMEGEGHEPPSGGINGAVHQLLTKQLDSRESQMASNAVKMEETQGLNNLSRNLNFSSALSSGSDHHQFWSNNGWTDLSGFSSSTSNNIL